MNVTKAQAVKVYEAICERHGEEPQPVVSTAHGERIPTNGRPALVRDWDWTSSRWSVVWEEGPYDWAMVDAMGGISEGAMMVADALGTAPKETAPVATPSGTYLEPINGWSTAICKA